MDDEEELPAGEEDTAPQAEAPPADPIASLGQEIMADAPAREEKHPLAALGDDILAESQKSDTSSQIGEEPQAEGQLASAARAAAHTVIPGVAGAAGWFPGAAAGATIGSVIPGLGTVGGGIVGGLITSFLGGGAAALAQEWLLKKLGFDDEAQQAANLKENPVATGVGAVAGLGPTIGVGGGAALVTRALSGVIGGGVDLAMTGDPTHAAAVGATSTLLNKPTALGRAAMSAGEQLSAKIGLGGAPAEKLTSTLAKAMQEDPKSAEAQANPTTGATVDGAATKVPKDPTLAREAVKTPGNDTPGPVAAAGTAEEAIPPPKRGIATEELQNTPYRDGGNDGRFAKDAVPEGEANIASGREIAPLGTLSRDMDAVLRPREGEVFAPGEQIPDFPRSPTAAEIAATPPTPSHPRLQEAVARANEARQSRAQIGQETGQPEPAAPQQQAQQEQGKAPLPERTPENIRQRIRQIEYDRRLSRVGDEPYPPHGELSALRRELKEAEAPRQQAQQEQGGEPAPKGAAVDRTMDLIKSLKDEEGARAAAKENPPSEFDAAAMKAVEAGKKYGTLGRQARQQDEPFTGGPPGGKPPGGGSTLGGAPAGGQPPKKPSIAPAEPTTRYKEGEKGTPELAAETVNRGFDNLSRNQNARWHEFQDQLKKITKDYSTLKGKGGEDVYHAIEQGTLDKLDPKIREGWDKVKSFYEGRIKAGEQELVKRGVLPAEEIGDPTHIHRIRNMPFSLSEWLNRDPTGMMKGMSKPDPFKALEYRGAESPDGHRIVVQDMSPTKYAVWKDGKQSIYGITRDEGVKGFKTGDKFEYNGKDYTVDRGHTLEIEQHARDEKGEPLKYKKNAMLSLYEHDQQVQSALEHDDMVRTFKSDPALDPFRKKANTPEGQAMRKEGWKELHGEAFKDFEGLVMHPDMAQALRNNFDPGLGMHASAPINLMRAINQFAVRSIFWNPIPHSFNATIHFLGARGEDWLPVTFAKNSWRIEKVGLDNYRNFIKSLGMGWKDVVKQEGTLIDLNRAGAPLVMSGIERARAHELTGKLLGTSLKSEPKFWGSAAQKFGLGKAVDAVKAVYDGSSRFLWSAGDIMMSARIHENEMKGMTREQAMTDASIHMPDYVLQNKLLGMRGLPSMMADPGVFMFGRYHSKVVDSLAHMAMGALGPNSSTEERRKAFGNIGALVFMGAVLYPAADAAVQKLTGNPDASQRRRGPLAPITNIQEGVKGEKTYANTMSNLLTLSPGAKFITEGLLTNRDFTGRNIIEPKSSLTKQAAQAAEYTAGNFVSPYKTVSDAFNPKSTKHPLIEGLAESVADVKVPTEGQKKGAFKGEQMRQSQAAQRDKKPRGLIEYGTNQITSNTPKVAKREPKASTLTRDPLADLGNEIMRGAGQ